jgi:hypothetical protein
VKAAASEGSRKHPKDEAAKLKRLSLGAKSFQHYRARRGRGAGRKRPSGPWRKTGHEATGRAIVGVAGEVPLQGSAANPGALARSRGRRVGALDSEHSVFLLCMRAEGWVHREER